VRRKINDTPRQTIKNELLKRIHKGVPDSRMWSLERWDDGYRRVFHPETFAESSEGSESHESKEAEETDDTDSDSDSTEE
jgi:hypothetical protein